MGKKFLGIKLSTYLVLLLSLVCAVIFWLYVNVNSPKESGETAGISELLTLPD